MRGADFSLAGFLDALPAPSTRRSCASHAGRAQARRDRGGASAPRRRQGQRQRHRRRARLTKDGWWLLRASNTRKCSSRRCEPPRRGARAPQAQPRASWPRRASSFPPMPRIERRALKRSARSRFLLRDALRDNVRTAVIGRAIAVAPAGWRTTKPCRSSTRGFQSFFSSAGSGRGRLAPDVTLSEAARLGFLSTRAATMRRASFPSATEW